MAGTVIRSFAAPGVASQSLTWDGRDLWLPDASTSLIYQIDPGTGTAIRSFATPGAASVGLTFDGRTLWLVDVTAATIYQINL